MRVQLFTGRIGTKTYLVGSTILAFITLLLLGALLLTRMKPSLQERNIDIALSLLLLPVVVLFISLRVRRAHDRGYSSWRIFEQGYPFDVLWEYKNGDWGKNKYGKWPGKKAFIKELFGIN